MASPDRSQPRYDIRSTNVRIEEVPDEEVYIAGPASFQLKPEACFTTSKKPYKPAAQRVHLVRQTLPVEFQVKHKIKGDPLTNMPKLSAQPAPFVPTGRYMQERHNIIDKVHKGDFLRPAEHNLMHNFMAKHKDSFTWNNDEKGHFCEDFFPPVEMPIISHMPWVLRNMPIPLGLYDKSQYSQPKCELFGLMCALTACKIYLIGVHNLIVEVNARFIKGMLNNPDVHPKAIINWWIVTIHLFHFKLVHVPKEVDDWVDRTYGFLQLINIATAPGEREIVSALVDLNLAHAREATVNVILNLWQTDMSLHPVHYDLAYSDFPQSVKAKSLDEQLVPTWQWLQDMSRPEGMIDTEYNSFVRWCCCFFT
ncbi:hypothetical protein FISHEDRAFT_71736 [Fistulina hepatica ATCC 64428]|uniref:Reverse transcriptase RNase H-like domain-containing protein n=1 Tax=Fistulina hepatica ATCC 64428 TaxID=1128425 RepID=A0A0D7AGZ4_9AGAR|nr:hypothetical protein FISHEDRAFT_71736 [Fistulina hepatica ATCC 64428]